MEQQAVGRLPFVMVDELEKKNVRVVYQGVEGAYAQQAMFEFFGEDVNHFHVERWRDAMEAIAEGMADYAVLPIENSSAGIVNDNYDLLQEFDNYIVGEQVMTICHALLGTEDAELSDIQTVYSHPQGLMQCAKYLDENRQWQQISLLNTAVAAQKVAEKLAQVSRRKQVLCVTHLPQLAAMADTHFSVEKGERKGRTYTEVVQLDRERRKAELARITGGTKVTEALLESAGELLDGAEAYRKGL